jgi:hypothetical protein
MKVKVIVHEAEEGGWMLIRASPLSGIVVLPSLLTVTFIFPHFSLNYRLAEANLLK